jgi:hypothetical protein
MMRISDTTARRATFVDALRSEWTKFRTLRSTIYIVSATVLLAWALGAVFSGATGAGYARLAPHQRAGFDPTSLSLQGGVLLSQLAIGALGVLVISSEYTTGMIRTSLAAVPCRGRLLAAKTVVFAAIALALGQAAAFGAFLVGQPLMSAQGAPHAALGQAHVLPSVVGAGLFLLLIGLLGLALGFVIRSTAGAIMAVVMVTLVPDMLAPLLGRAFSTYWPTIAALQVTSVLRDPSGPSPWVGLGLLGAAVAGAIAVAHGVFRSRDA